MKKSRVLAVAVVVALLAILLLLRALGTRARITDEPSGAKRTEASSRELELGAEDRLQPARSAETSSSSQDRLPGRTADAKLRTSLRIHVLYQNGSRDEAPGLDVGVANLAGTILTTRHVGPNEFVLAEEPPGSYVVAVKAQGYRPAVVPAEMGASAAESSVTLTLTPVRRLSLRWRAADGRPIEEALLDPSFPDEVARLAIAVTKVRWPREHVPSRSETIALVEKELLAYEDAQGSPAVRDARFDPRLESPAEKRRSDDLFADVEISEDGPLWVSAFSRGECVAMQPVGSEDAEAVIISPLADLVRKGSSLRVVVIDDLTGAPIEGAWIMLDGEDTGDRSSDANGLLVCDRLRPGPRVATIATESYSHVQKRITLRTDEELDLGTIRLGADYLAATCRVVDERGAIAVGVGFELVEFEEDRSGPPRVVLAATSDIVRDAEHPEQAPNLTLFPLSRGRYLLRCRGLQVDALPLVLEEHALTPYGHPRTASVIVVRRACATTLVIDPPIAEGTRAVIETPDGVPLRELDLDLFGTASTDLLPSSYRLHLVEYGLATEAVEMVVDRNPCVIHIHR